ncbi:MULTISPECIES: acyl-CoA dehydrogenase family protein [Gordonia]|jgi:alkylation response protein AidB-like acyl-CoA dehydrogenase|uniref:Acyl-CoA dehydrogenase n=2 Tax=Gordonia alkanivorans TaxID=84096 RepID=W9DBT9_9ACTN|nr:MULTISPECIES: acyl-CoA dehydrogenase family protein [Gordonia]AZZ79972.1 acyl-CoA dehydrogenase [Gordonia alkanivorans]ETA06888.1 acyl-CoA dehydrogenase [Gordonia alkanivorans CGMCC 6845]MDH3007242.1 acyl-CoA dehydrogenase family protein [Gordonia alkanivorans]MDH3012949.1 acyl-CoA dehydrogenase family protein [Gordonia alkanivorans]MDH3016955.1 acyl-CoA dehydrogenase family protein [Gordonia alkanivorans]
MHLKFSPEEEAFREELRGIFAKVPEDLRKRNEEGSLNYPDDIVTASRVLNEHGILTPSWPIEWGGKDWTPIQHHIYREEMSLAFVPDPLPFNVSMIGPVIAQFGSQEMKEKFLPKTANLDIWWCQGFSEPEAGSDLASLKTRAVLDGDHYVINGQKTWTTLGQYADWIFLLARTNPDVKKQAGISMFLIPMDTPGIELRPIQLIDGSYEVNEVFFNDVRVPVENMVGEENSGWTQAKFLLGNERNGIARVGYTKSKLARAKELAKETRTANGTLLDDPLFATRLAELENELLALEITQLRVAASSADGKPNPASSLLKLKGSQLQQAAMELIADIAGPDSLPVAEVDVDAANGSAAVTAPEWAQLAAPTYLNYRKVSIYGGSSEVQRQIIDKAVLGL